VARTLASERAVEVVVHAEGEAKKKHRFECEPEEILVMFSSGLVLGDARAQGSKMALPGLQILLLGASQQEADFLQYVPSGIRGFLPVDAGAKEIANAVEAVSRGDTICGGAECSVFVQPP